MASKYYFSTRDLLVIAVLAALGGVLSTYVSYLANMINHLVGVPFGAGNVVAGLHVLWLLLMIAITRKIGSGLIGGAVKGFVEFITGNPHGIVVVVISTIEGIGAEVGYWPFRKYRTVCLYAGRRPWCVRQRPRLPAPVQLLRQRMALRYLGRAGLRVRRGNGRILHGRCHGQPRGRRHRTPGESRKRACCLSAYRRRSRWCSQSPSCSPQSITLP